VALRSQGRAEVGELVKEKPPTEGTEETHLILNFTHKRSVQRNSVTYLKIIFKLCIIWEKIFLQCWSRFIVIQFFRGSDGYIFIKTFEHA
jgi:hypothetical protein